MGAAGRILENGLVAEITNYSGNRLVRIDQLPALLFPRNKSCFINDLESTAYGILGLSHNNLLGDYFQPYLPLGLEKNIPPSLLHQNYLIVAAGTGLGMALIYMHKGRFEILPCEAGHCLISAVANDQTEEEKQLVQYLGEKLYGGKTAIEFEDIVSGRGISHVYSWLTREKNEKPDSWLCSETPAELVSAAIAGSDDNAKKALELHYRYLARACQNLAVAVQAKGIFWAGDNQVANYKFVDEIEKEVEEVLYNHPKTAWLRETRIFCQNKELNVNLVGTLYFANERL